MSGLPDDKIERLFHRLATDIAEKLGQIALANMAGSDAGPDPSRLYLDKFPLTHGIGRREERLIGREQELALLDLAFAQPHTAIVSLVAWGGVGKTMLVQHWLRRLQREGWFGARRVYGWSFYSQGTKEDRQASEDAFLAHALQWFGVQCEPTLSPWDKGRLLADAVARERTLLILDGIEPLQYPPGPMGGQLRAPGVQSLLKQLARKVNDSKHRGLCLVTTREQLTDLTDLERRPKAAWGSVLRLDLGNLAEDAGAALLHHAGATRAGAAKIKADDAELLAASREVDGHALTLHLLGRFLARAHSGDIRRRDLVKFKEADRAVQGGTTFRMLTAFENWFALSGDFEARQLAVLRMLGLFDRPADAGCIIALREPLVIAGLTDPLFTTRFNAKTGRSSSQPLREQDWNTVTSFLADFGLILIQADKDNRESLLDCHPLIREYFATRLRDSNADAWRKGHGCLYAHLLVRAKEHPDSIEEMEPLYQAVGHGCKAGRDQEALDEVYHRRIQRGEAAFAIDTLGTIGADLAALASFFKQPWSVPASVLTEKDRTFVTGQAAFRLTALGRLHEALIPNHLLVEQRVEQAEREPSEKAWNNACYSSGNLAAVYSLLGDLRNARKYADQAVRLAEKGAAHWQREMTFAGRAEVAHQAGDPSAALKDFLRAEAIARQNSFGFLSSVQGLRYCDYLVDQGQNDEAGWRAQAIIMQGMACGWTVDVGLGHLILARTKMSLVGHASHAELGIAVDDCDAAMRALRGAGFQDKVIRCLLTRAELRRLTDDFCGALADLDEARENATRCGMRLLVADCDLGYSRYYLGQSQGEKASEYLSVAQAMIEEMGYHRRDVEVRELQQAISKLMDKRA